MTSQPSNKAHHSGQTRQPVTRWKGFQLLGFQIQAIEALRAGENVLLAAPTGAGKTLVAEYAIQDAVTRGRRCVYTAPIKALSNQKYRDFRDDPEIDVGLLTGDVTIHPSAQVLIMTTEILRNAIFEDPAGLHDVDYVIFDEVHFMDDIERGSVWEESLIFAPPEIRFIGLSATIKNLDQLGAWIREIRPQELSVIQSKRRPVPLKHRLHTAEAGVFDIGRLEWVKRQGSGGGSHARGHGRGRGRGKDRDHGGRGRGGGRFAGNRYRRRFEAGDLDSLFDDLQSRSLLPALVFSFSRKDCERLAHRSQQRGLLDREEAARMDTLQRDLIRIFQLDESELQGEVFQLARGGVAYHHAGMLPIHKEVVERMFTLGLLKLLFTTETFALGINMPARTVVFAALRKFDGVQFDYLRTRDYLQMAGRAGRQGLDDEGLVIAHIDQSDLAEAPLERLHSGSPEPVDSRFRLSYASILHLYDHLGRERLHEAWDKSFNRFQHRAKSRKARERNQRLQRELVDAHLTLLEELGYLRRAGGITARGRIARLLYGWELVITEMLFAGALEPLPPLAIAIVFVGLVFEDRRRGATGRAPARLFGGVRRQIDNLVRRLSRDEARCGLPPAQAPPDWSLAPAVEAWFDQASFKDLEDLTALPPGEICRALRQAVQLMRQVAHTLDPEDSLRDRLEEAVEHMNRDEVDARRQLALG